MKLFTRKPQKTPREQRDELIDGALVREQVAAAEMARAADYKATSIENCLVAEEADEDRLEEELREIVARKARLCELRGGVFPKSD